MATFAIGDVHGSFSVLVKLLEYAKVKSSDQLIMLGDYVDRGPDSARVIELLIEKSKAAKTVCIKGNHEIMMERARDDQSELKEWLLCGGDVTLDSYSREFAGQGIDAVPEDHWQFIDQCFAYHETDSHVFVHAAVYGGVDLCDQPDYVLFWESFHSISPLESGKVVICGHTSQKSGIPISNGHAVCIDTYAHGKGGWLTCLNVDTGEYHQANQDGETRSEWIEGYDLR